MPGDAEFVIEFAPGEQHKFNRLTSINTYNKTFRGFVGRVLDEAVEEAKKHAPVDTGALRRSIKRRSTPGSAGAGYGGYVQASVPYALFVEKGTAPHWPPVGALAGWASRKGIPEFLVARKIARQGTKPQPFMEKGRAAAKKAIPRSLQWVSTEVEKIWAAS